MLKNHRQCYDGLPGLSVQQQTTGANTKFCLALQDFVDRIDAGKRLFNLNLQPRVPVITLFFSRVITSELKSVRPLQLQSYGIECPDWRGQQQPAARGNEPTGPSLIFRHPVPLAIFVNNATTAQNE